MRLCHSTGCRGDGGCGICDVGGDRGDGGDDGCWRQERSQYLGQEGLKMAQLFKGLHAGSFPSVGGILKWKHHCLEPGAVLLTHERTTRVALKQREDVSSAKYSDSTF